MKKQEYSYTISYRMDDYDNRIVVLSQTELPKGPTNTFEIPESDLGNVVTKLSNVKSIIDEPIVPFEQQTDNRLKLEPNIIQTLVALFLSGVSLKDLSNQYDYPTDIIKMHLEEKGIVIFDEI
jgi:hypothetical protein